MNFWKEKLAAYLHDPPSKALDIRTHGERSDAAFRQAGFADEEEIGRYFDHADHTGAAADRLPFPGSQASGLQCAFDGVRNAFRHPLSGHPIPFHAEFKSVEQGFEGEQSVQPALSETSLGTLDDERWRARFFAHWRLWPKHAMEKDYRLALLPADTRIPDHSIWTHMQVVSALAGCIGDDKVWKPAFLKFQLGPVQDFIAAARSTRDLWSGSYLLSWLMAAGLKALSEKVGPDAVIFPNLRGQPLFDLHWRDDLWAKVSIGNHGSVWDSLAHHPSDLLTPNLPNLFLAIVPADNGAELARIVSKAIQGEWKRIAAAVWAECKRVGLTDDEGEFTASQRKNRFDAQVTQFLSLTWQVTPWPDTLEEAIRMGDGFAQGSPIAQARNRVQRIVEMAEVQMPGDHRDGRFYVGNKGGPREKLNNIGLGWSVVLALNSWELDAVRQTRNFEATSTSGWRVGTFSNKDALTGREEAVAGGDAWFRSCASLGNFWPQRFKHPHWLGAPSLIKRLWDIAYLIKPKWDLATQRSPNTRGIAAHDPFAKDDRFNNEDQAQAVEDQPSSEKYFAVLAFDGDEIGKWISGENTPKLSSQLADYKDGSGNPGFGSKPYFAGPGFGQFLESQRPVSPSYHLQFSEALSNFALLCVRPIVEAFDGRLVYAGGDDVVALLPADTALECARALRMAFQGSKGLKEMLKRSAATLRQRHRDAQRDDPNAAPPPQCQELAAEGRLFDSEHEGSLRRLDRVDQQQRPVPFLVPGPAADCSVGVAIAHFKAPLQDVVRAAQTAEKRAKNSLGRSAAAVTLIKRSGEIIEWGCQWDSGGLTLYHEIAEAMSAGKIGLKFPHRLCELLVPYLTASTKLSANAMRGVDGFDALASIRKELEFVISRQGRSDQAKAALRQAWLEQRDNPERPSLIEAFWHWTTELEGRAAAAKALKLVGQHPGLASTEQRLKGVFRAMISADSNLVEEVLAELKTLSNLSDPSLKGLSEKAFRESERLRDRVQEAPIESLVGLCQTVAFTHRISPDSDTGSVPRDDV